MSRIWGSPTGIEASIDEKAIDDVMILGYRVGDLEFPRVSNRRRSLLYVWKG